MKNKIHVHFMGISGSGCSAAAFLAQKAGFQVSGCDLKPDSTSTRQLKRIKITPRKGHSPRHLQKVDFLVVSPAVYEINPDHPEILEARKKKILLTWQEFVGRFLQKDKFVIAIAGTHGKTTITALVGLVLERAGLDPTVLVGGLVPDWQTNARAGQGRYFVCEADEFNNNFLHYSPNVAIINNLEMDHPEFFQDEKQLLQSFQKFIARLKPPRVLIVNSDDPGLRRLLTQNQAFLEKNKFQVIAYHLYPPFSFPFDNDFQAKILRQDRFFTQFSVLPGQQKGTIEEEFRLRLPGRHNVVNALSVFALSRVLNLPLSSVKEVFTHFKGVKRRLDCLGEVNRIKVYDDYGHHPTQISAVLEALRQTYPETKIWAVLEPHQISRLRTFTADFVQALKKADQVIITQIFWGREKKSPGLMPKDLVSQIGRLKARSIDDFQKVARYLARQVEPGGVIIVFGAGQSYKLAQMILSQLKDQ